MNRLYIKFVLKSYFLQVPQSNSDGFIFTYWTPLAKWNDLILVSSPYSRQSLLESVLAVSSYSSIHSLTAHSKRRIEAGWRSPRELSIHNDRALTRQCSLMVVLGAFWLTGHHFLTTFPLSLGIQQHRENSIATFFFFCIGKTAISLKVNLKTLLAKQVCYICQFRNSKF